MWIFMHKFAHFQILATQLSIPTFVSSQVSQWFNWCSLNFKKNICAIPFCHYNFQPFCCSQHLACSWYVWWFFKVVTQWKSYVNSFPFQLALQFVLEPFLWYCIYKPFVGDMLLFKGPKDVHLWGVQMVISRPKTMDYQFKNFALCL